MPVPLLAGAAISILGSVAGGLIGGRSARKQQEQAQQERDALDRRITGRQLLILMLALLQTLT